MPLRSGRALAYNALSGGLALWEAPEKRFYDLIGDGLALDESATMVRAFHRGGYIAPTNADELAIIEKQYTAHRYDAETMILTIAPTLACNFGCDYCFQGQDKDPATMSPQVQDAIVGLVQRVAPKIKRLHIAWYGGEPLVRVNIIEALSDRIIPLCDRHGIKYDAMIVTNVYTSDAANLDALMDGVTSSIIVKAMGLVIPNGALKFGESFALQAEA